MFTNCPECDKALRGDAFKCSCGWKKPAIDASYIQHIDCAYHGCSTSATVRIRKKTGWANLCVFHYSTDNLQESIDYCKKHGLDTTENKIAHIKALLATPKDPRAWMRNPKSEYARQLAESIMGPKPDRIPGEDDDLPEAA